MTVCGNRIIDSLRIQGAEYRAIYEGTDKRKARRYFRDSRRVFRKSLKGIYLHFPRQKDY